MPQSIPSEVHLTRTTLQSQSQNMSFHVFGRCNYLNYHLEILNSSLPHFSIKNKTATKQLGRTYLTWHVPCLTHLSPAQSRDPILTLIPTHKQGTQGEEGQQRTSNSIQTMVLVQRKRTQRGHIRVQDKEPVCDTTKARYPLPSASLRNHITPVPEINSYLIPLT